MPYPKPVYAARARRSEGDFLNDAGLVAVLRRAGLAGPRQGARAAAARATAASARGLDPWGDPLALRALLSVPQPSLGSGSALGPSAACAPRAPDPEGMRGRQRGRSAAIQALLGERGSGPCGCEAGGAGAADAGASIPIRVRGGGGGGCGGGAAPGDALSAPARLPLLSAEADGGGAPSGKDARPPPPTTAPIPCGRPSAPLNLLMPRSLEDSAGAAHLSVLGAGGGGDTSAHSGMSGMSGASAGTGASEEGAASAVADSVRSVEAAGGLSPPGEGGPAGPPACCAQMAGAKRDVRSPMMVEL